MAASVENSYESGYVGTLAFSLGATEPALRLLISLLAGYPMALFHRYTLYGSNPFVQHLYFIISGIIMSYFNFGIDVIHSFISILTTYVLLKVQPGTKFSVGFSFFFNLSYLVIGYYLTCTDSYDIKWTMPHCVLTLRLTGLVVDVYDGHKSPNKLSQEQVITARKEVPSLLEVAGFTYFFGGFLVGPQFSIQRYFYFVRGIDVNSENPTREPPACIVPAIKRFGIGLLYLALYQIASQYLPSNFIIEPEFESLSFFMKCTTVAIWGKLVLYKYMACWLIAEGVCILTSLSYNGKDEHGNYLWDGCANVNLKKCELAVSFGQLIESFNINTNQWMAKYIFKRLRFLGNKLISQIITLWYLAVWHGIFSGYYMCFFMELIIMVTEKGVGVTLHKAAIVRKIRSNIVSNIILWSFQKYCVLLFMGYSLVPFVLLTYDRWLKVYSNLYFCGHIVYLGWPIAYFVLKPLVLIFMVEKSIKQEKKKQ